MALFGGNAKLIGVYRSRERAEAAIARLRGQSGFRDNPTGFVIDEYPFAKDHWTEGVVNVELMGGLLPPPSARLWRNRLAACLAQKTLWLGRRGSDCAAHRHWKVEVSSPKVTQLEMLASTGIGCGTASWQGLLEKASPI